MGNSAIVLKGASPIRTEMHNDRYLTNYSVGYMQGEERFVSNAASSQISVNKQTDKILTVDRGDMWRDQVEKRPLGGKPPMADFGTSSDSYIAEEYGLEGSIDARQRANADDPLNLEEEITRLLSQQHMIKRDRIWCTSFFAASVWTKQMAGVSSSPSTNQFVQFDQIDSDPLGVIDEMIDYVDELTGMRPNTIVCSADVRRVLRRHPQIQAVLPNNEQKQVSNARLAQLFEVDNFRVPRSIYNSAAEGAANSFSYIAGTKRMWLGYIEPNPTVRSPTAIATFNWTGLMPGATNSMGGTMLRDYDKRAHSDIFQMGMAWAQKQVVDDLGVYFTTVIA